jgi:hypothetical protein
VPQKDLKRPGKEEIRIRQKVANVSPKKLACSSEGERNIGFGCGGIKSSGHPASVDETGLARYRKVQASS